MASGGYGMASYDMDGTQAYGATATYGATGVNTNSSAYSAEPQLSPEQKSMSRLLSASGVPNDKGQLRWPLGLAILAAPEADALCDQIDALFEVAASQAAGGQVNPVLVEEAQRAVTKLRRLLLKDKAKRFGMPLAVYEESERFLDKLDRADQFLRAGMGTPAGQRPVTKASSTTDSTGSHK